MSGILAGPIFFIGFAIFIVLLRSVRILNEYERAVVFRLGRVIGAKGPGLVLLVPILDTL